MAKQEVDFELVAALEASELVAALETSEVEGKTKENAVAAIRGASVKVRVQSNNDYVAALDKYGLVNYVTKTKNYSLRTDGTVDEHSPELHPEYSALKFVDGASDDECLVATPTANSR